MKKICIAVLAMMMVFSLQANAQEGPTPTVNEQRAFSRAHNLQEKFGLSEEQRSKIGNICVESFDAITILKGEDDKPSKENKGKIKALKVKRIADIKALLNADQNKKYTQYLAKKEAKKQAKKKGKKLGKKGKAKGHFKK